MRGARRLDAAVAIGFVAAATAEAAWRDLATPGLLIFETAGALTLLSLAVRRQRPVLTIGTITGAAVVGAGVTQLVWPSTDDGAGVWIFALMLAAYSLGAHGRGRVVVLGAFLPLAVVLSADLMTRTGWPRVSGILFVTVFVGVLPTTAGRLVRLRSERLAILREQHDRIVVAQQSRFESAVLAERVRAAKRLNPTLVHGLQVLASMADSHEAPGEVEAAARRLLARTRQEVVTLTAPVRNPPPAEQPAADHLAALRAAAQPWTVIAAGAVAAGLCVESTQVLVPTASGWMVVPAGLAVGAPLALLWWRPVVAVALAWMAATTYSRSVAPLDGSLSEVALAFATVFAAAALSRKAAAVVGLAVCLAGQLVGVGSGDGLGEAAFLFVCWLGGRALHEVSRLVEQTHHNNEVLAGQEEANARRAVVDERLRLAREIHDVIGHSLTVVALQAGAARRLARTDPARAREVMGTVAAVARDGVAALVPDDGVADIATLIERLRATGLAVEADLAGRALLDPGQQVVALRIVQEALTNVLRHAPGSEASVGVREVPDGVELVVVNSAPTGPGSGPGTGRGLVGLRERVVGAAGDLTWGPRGDGGFEVRALLPVAALAEASTS